MSATASRIEELRAELRSGRLSRQDVQRRGRELMDLTDALAADRAAALGRSPGTLAAIHESLARLRAIRSLAELLPAAAHELARSCGFDRTVVSRRRGSVWRAEAVWLSPEVPDHVAAATRAYVTERWIPIRPGTLESDLVRRRVAAIVAADDERVDRELVTETDSRQYVASPILPSGSVIGFLQADCWVQRRPLTETDRDNLWTFADGFGLIFQHLALLDRLDEQHSRVHDALAAVERSLTDLRSGEHRLIRQDPLPDDLLGPVSGSSRLAGLLTVREREVLELLASGARNKDIAERLVLSEATVRTHIRKIARKLHVSSRAEAVSRYLRMRG